MPVFLPHVVGHVIQKESHPLIPWRDWLVNLGTEVTLHVNRMLSLGKLKVVAYPQDKGRQCKIILLQLKGHNHVFDIQYLSEGVLFQNDHIA